MINLVVFTVQMILLGVIDSKGTLGNWLQYQECTKGWRVVVDIHYPLHLHVTILHVAVRVVSLQSIVIKLMRYTDIYVYLHHVFLTSPIDGQRVYV